MSHHARQTLSTLEEHIMASIHARFDVKTKESGWVPFCTMDGSDPAAFLASVNIAESGFVRMYGRDNVMVVWVTDSGDMPKEPQKTASPGVDAAEQAMRAARDFVAWINTEADIPEGYQFHLDTPGQKYVRIYFTTHTDKDTGKRRGASAHAFVDIATGDLLKAASWKAPAKGARGNLVTDMDEVKERFTWAGGYLYLR